MPRTGTKQQRGYGAAYEAARKRLLAGGPKCHWCDRPATTADHVPPISEVGPHLNLVPACGPCNFGRRDRPRTPIVRPSRDW